MGLARLRLGLRQLNPLRPQYSEGFSGIQYCRLGQWMRQKALKPAREKILGREAAAGALGWVWLVMPRQLAELGLMPVRRAQAWVQMSEPEPLREPG
jgi:hypothetical protein